MFRCLLLAALLSAAPAWAQDCSGTWEGTLDGAPLMLQFNWDHLGSYYTGTSLAGTVLRPRAEEARTWEEFEPAGQRTGTLRLACRAGGMEGERIDSEGRRQVLRAARAEDNSYNRRRLAAAELVVQRALQENGRVLEVVNVRGLPQLATARIREPRAGESKVNEVLRTALLRQLDNHLLCRALLRARGDTRPGGDTLSVQRLEWQGTILSVQSWLRGECGGPVAYAGLQQFVFDTASGAELPLEGWLLPEYRDGAAAVTPLYQELALPHVLRGRRQLEELPQAKRECAEYELAESAQPRAVEGRGMVFGFSYPPRMASCGLEFVLPWAQLGDYLSDDGRRWLAAMQAQPRR